MACENVKAWLSHAGVPFTARNVEEDGAAYEAVIYRDGADKSVLVIEKKSVSRGDVLSVPMLAAGGFAVRLTPTR